jgi:dTDP-4-amino-4,6-dideoxygalactose transaminase
LWNGIKPVFVDIDKNTLNIDPNKIEAAITENTSAIMPVHCYGTPCDVDEIEKIANKYNLKVIYDAAHAFGVKCHCGSILNHGDLSVLSFHATKVFNTFEGGAIISKSLEMKKRIDHLKNFGFLNEVTVVEAGINGKMSEINAAFGLLQLKYVQKAIDERRDIDGYYRQELRNVKGISFVAEGIHFERNFSYFPILVGDDYKMTRDQLYELLKSNGINTRRYFYPIISNFPMYSEFDSAKPELLPEANKAGAQILCLPIYPGLSFNNLDTIINLIK